MNARIGILSEVAKQFKLMDCFAEKELDQIQSSRGSYRNVCDCIRLEVNSLTNDHGTF